MAGRPVMVVSPPRPAGGTYGGGAACVGSGLGFGGVGSRYETVTNVRPRVLWYSSSPAVLAWSRCGIFRLTCQFLASDPWPLIIGTSITPSLLSVGSRAHCFARRVRSKLHLGAKDRWRTPLMHVSGLNEGWSDHCSA